MMKLPVQTPSGTCYEKKSIEDYIQHSGPKDPITFKPFKGLQDCALNKAFKLYIEDFVKKNPWAHEYFDNTSQNFEDIEFAI